MLMLLLVYKMLLLIYFPLMKDQIVRGHDSELEGQNIKVH